MSKTVSVAEAKSQFSDMLAKVKHKRERLVIQKRGKPIAAIVPMEDLEALEKTGNQGLLALVGAFSKSADFPDLVDDIVRARRYERTRRVPGFGK